LASTPITLTKVEAEVTAPSEAAMGSTISVEWRGPDYEDDYIGIGKVGAAGGSQWQNYSYTAEGNPATLLVPAEAGDYMIHYFAQQNRSLLSATPITVTSVKAQLLADPTASAGAQIVVGWDGPNYDDDYIGIGKVGAAGGSQWETYSYTQDGNPATVTVPDTPGDYVIQYFMSQGRTPIANLPLTIE
jgi:Ca-activated chloride channel family protein